MTSPYLTYFTVKVYSNDTKNTLLASTTNVSQLTTNEQLNAISTYRLTLNLSDPLTAGIGKGCYFEVWIGRTQPQTLRLAGYVSQITESPNQQAIYDLDIDDAMIVLTEYRCPDGLVMNYPHYKDILDALNGIKDRVSPGCQGMLPVGWTAVWLDPHWQYVDPNTGQVIKKGGSKPPGRGDSWATALETPFINLQTFAAHYGFTFRVRPGSTRSSGVVELLAGADDSGLVVWGGEKARLEINARSGVDYPRINLGEGQNLGLTLISDVKYTDTLDTVYNAYIGPGMGPGHDSITLRSFWPSPPDQYAAANPTVAGVSNPWQPVNPGRAYYLGTTCSNWDGSTYTNFAFRRNDGTWEFGVLDVPSGQKYGIREQLLQRGNKKIIDAFHLESACIGSVAYNKDPVPSMEIDVVHPRTDASAIPHPVKPGQFVTCHYQGEVQAYIIDTTNGSPTFGLAIPNPTNPYVYLNWPNSTDPVLIRQAQTVKQVQETYAVGGHKATYTLGRAKYKYMQFNDALAQDLQDEITSKVGSKHTWISENFGGNIHFLFSQNPDTWEDFQNKRAAFRPGGIVVSDVPDDRFFGKSTEVRFTAEIDDALQYLDFWFAKSVWNPGSATVARYGLFRLALAQSGQHSGFYYTPDGTTWNNVGTRPNPKAISTLAPGLYPIRVTWSHGQFDVYVTLPDPRHPSVTKPVLVATWKDTAGKLYNPKTGNFYDTTVGAIGWNLRGGSLPGYVQDVSLSPWQYHGNHK